MPTYSSAPDPFGDMLLKLIMTRAAQGESEIKETIERNAHTAGVMPFVQALVAGVGLLAALLGIALIGAQASFLFDLRLMAGDYLLIGTAVLLLILGVVAALRVLANQYSTATIALLSGAIVLVLVVAAMAAILSSREQLTTLRAAAIALGLVLLIPGVALAYRELVDLMDPFGKTSAMERMIRPYFGQLFGQVEEPDQARGRLVPYSNNSGSQPLSVGTGMLNEDDADLIEFTERAASIGLSRRVWLGQKLRMSGNTVTQDRHIALIRRLIEFRYVEPGGEGHPARWKVDPLEAVAELRQQAEELTREG